LLGLKRRPRAPDEVLVGQHGEAIDEVEIEGGSSFAELLALAVGAVEVGLEVEVGSAGVAGAAR